MGKALYIAEKPSVAQEFARVLKVNGRRSDGYIESDDSIVTWCVGHLVTMSYPEAYDIKYKRWSMNTLPFIPDDFKYEVIPDVAKQFKIVSGLLNRNDVETIYVCTDSGREGEYIYRLVEQMSGPEVRKKDRRRVWIDSQTEEEILRGIREAKDLSSYDDLADSAYLRAKEDYLIGINFSRVLTLKYGKDITDFLGGKWTAIAAGRVMTCVLGMVVRREREIRSFVKTPFYRVIGQFAVGSKPVKTAVSDETADPAASDKQAGQPAENRPYLIDGEWRVSPGSAYEGSPLLYKENGFRKRETAEELIHSLEGIDPQNALVEALEKKTEKKAPPLLYNLAELQNDGSRLFKLSPDQTLNIAQELYEKKLTTYPRTDARVLTTAVAKEIDKNLNGLTRFEPMAGFASDILKAGSWKGIAKTKYTNDKAVTDHYAIIPTGAGLQNLKSLSPTSFAVYKEIVRRFLSVFYPPAEYRKISLTLKIGRERFYASYRLLTKEGYLALNEKKDKNDDAVDPALIEMIMSLKKGSVLPVCGYTIKEGETTPPKRYTSGSMILAMENAGQLIEDESLREQIKGSGIGTSATRAEILKKLVKIRYLNLNKKTQVITPELLGEMVYDAVSQSIRSLLNPELTASWEKGLTYVAEGTIEPEEYMTKLETFIRSRVENVRSLNNSGQMLELYKRDAAYYKPQKRAAKKG